MSRPRAVVLVANAAAPYSRGLRVARSLAGAGFEVELAALADPSRPELPLEERDGPGGILVRRYVPAGRWARWSIGRPEPRGMTLLRLPEIALKLVAWPIRVRAWWATLRRELPPADLYHACGILAIPVALELGTGARGTGRRGLVVYDLIDAVLDSINVARIPAPVRAWYRWRETGWGRGADALVTVNDALADRFAARWPDRPRPTVLLNCPPRWDPPVPRPDLVRAATGLPPERRIVLFVGRLGPARGLDEAAEAILRVPDAALVLVGFGPWAERLRARDADARFVGRHFTLPAVHPDEVPAWTASADLSFVALPPVSFNQRSSTPNKLWESLASGTPVLVGRDLPVMRELVESERLGSVADPGDPDDLARGIREILDLPPAEAEALRARCLALAHERYNWEVAVTGYLALVERLVPAGAGGAPTA